MSIMLSVNNMLKSKPMREGVVPAIVGYFAGRAVTGLTGPVGMAYALSSKVIAHLASSIFSNLSKDKEYVGRCSYVAGIVGGMAVVSGLTSLTAMQILPLVALVHMGNIVGDIALSVLRAGVKILSNMQA